MTNKIALITGVNKGIGYETARQLGALGMTVLVGAREETRGQEAARLLSHDGADSRFVLLDVTDEKSVRQAAAWIEAEYGRLDVLINNVGSGDTSGPPKVTETAVTASLPGDHTQSRYQRSGPGRSWPLQPGHCRGRVRILLRHCRDRPGHRDRVRRHH